MKSKKQKKLPGFRFNYREKCWDCSPDQLDTLKQVMHEKGLGYDSSLFDVTQAIEELLSEETMKQNELYTTKQVQLTLDIIKKNKLL